MALGKSRSHYRKPDAPKVRREAQKAAFFRVRRLVSNVRAEVAFRGGYTCEICNANAVALAGLSLLLKGFTARIEVTYQQSSSPLNGW
jgi:hypothetical protein